MSEHEESKGFKVTDRRSFTPEGERREGVDESAPHEPLEPREPVGGASESPEPRSETPPRAAEFTRGGEAASDVGFIELLSLLATQASIALGGPHPVTGQSHEDLETARAMIRMIEVLKEKTAGNLNPDEARAVDSVLYQLRMQFVSKAKGKQS